jgi:hypothetical protein
VTCTKMTCRASFGASSAVPVLATAAATEGVTGAEAMAPAVGAATVAEPETLEGAPAVGMRAGLAAIRGAWEVLATVAPKVGPAATLAEGPAASAEMLREVRPAARQGMPVALALARPMQADRALV